MVKKSKHGGCQKKWQRPRKPFPLQPSQTTPNKKKSRAKHSQFHTQKMKKETLEREREREMAYQLSGLKSGGENKLVETRARHCVRVIGDLEKKEKKITTVRAKISTWLQEFLC